MRSSWTRRRAPTTLYTNCREGCPESTLRCPVLVMRAGVLGPTREGPALCTSLSPYGLCRRGLWALWSPEAGRPAPPPVRRPGVDVEVSQSVCPASPRRSQRAPEQRLLSASQASLVALGIAAHKVRAEIPAPSLSAGETRLLDFRSHRHAYPRPIVPGRWPSPAARLMLLANRWLGRTKWLRRPSSGLAMENS